MPEDAKEFVDSWISENVHPTGYEPEGDKREAKILAFQCWNATDKAGYSRGAIDVALGGDLVSYMAKSMDRINDHEIARLIAKND